MQKLILVVTTGLLLCCGFVHAQPTPPRPTFDAELAKSVGADDFGMRKYVLVVLKTWPTPVPAGKERDEMFKGHFANINRLAAEGKLALAGPFDGANGWRGLFILAVSDIEEAKQLTATDPVVSSGGDGRRIPQILRFSSLDACERCA
jgi:uncharacterized protein YciI